MTERATPQIPLPTFDNWASFSVGQLEAMLIAWEWIRDQPEWAMWHEGAKGFLREIEAELDRRAQERSRIALRRAIADWSMARNRLWTPVDAHRVTEAVEKLLSEWGDYRP